MCCRGYPQRGSNIIGHAGVRTTRMGPRPTANKLNQQFLFINKNLGSEHLTRSSGAEKTKVYGHVRQHMVKDNLVVREEFEHVFGQGSTAGTGSRKKKKLKALSHGKDRIHSGYESKVDEVTEASPRPGGLQIVHGRHEQRLGFTSGPPPALSAAPYARSHEYFRQRTISDATSFADRQFWDATMQLSAGNEAIFHALTSLGALHESLMNESSRHDFHQASLLHCNRAIRATISGDQNMSLPMILVTCVIFTTIQIFGDAPMAQRTLESGIKLVAVAQKQASHLSFSSSEQSILDLATRMIERYQSRFTLVLLPTTVVTEHLGRWTTLDDTVPSVPATFESLLQAREILQAICDWSFHVKKSAKTLSLTENLQQQWIRAIVQLSESTDLHPLSMRSVNILKIARLASACLIAAQFMTRKTKIDEYFPIFLRLLEQYSDDFKLCKSNAIFTVVFHIDAGIKDVLQQVADRNIDEALRLQAGEALRLNTLQSERHRENRAPSSAQPVVSSEEAEHAGDFRIQSLDFFAQSGLARLRLKRTVGPDSPDTEVRWFSILDTATDIVIPRTSHKISAIAELDSSAAPWIQDVSMRSES